MNMTMRILALVITTLLVCTTTLPAQVSPAVSSSGSSAGVNRTQPLFATPLPPSQSISINRRDPFSRGGPKTLVHVVPAGDITVDDLRAVQEDMTVMVGIFQKMLSQAHLTIDTGSPLFVGGLFGRSTESAQNIYLQGFGALFMLSVDFPLAPGPEKPEIPEDPPPPMSITSGKRRASHCSSRNRAGPTGAATTTSSNTARQRSKTSRQQ